MKTFQQYLVENERTYDYRIKVVGDTPEGFWNELEKKLAQFDIVKMTKPRSTPVMTTLKDFPEHKNQSVAMADVSFRYPAIEPQLQQISQLLGVQPTCVQLCTQGYADSMEQEMAEIESQNKDLLTDTDYPAPNAEQKELSQDYSADPYEHSVLKNAYRSEFTIAGGKTPPAETTNDLPQGVKSPMTKIVRPPRPATGANPRG
jgi:hypothetical protein